MLGLVSTINTASTGCVLLKPRPRSDTLGSTSRQAEEGDQEHAQQQEQQVLQLEATAIAQVALLEKAKGGEGERLRLLAHDQMHQDGQPGEQQSTQEIAVNPGHADALV